MKGLHLWFPELKKNSSTSSNNNPGAGNSINTNNSSNNGGGSLTPDENQLLNVNPDDYNESNVPPGFDPAPAKPIYVKGSTQEQYKAYMVAKYEYETWENKLLLHKLKLKKQIEELKAKKG